MNNTQIQTTIAPLVTFFAGLLAGKGVFGFDAATWATIIGGIGGVAATIWAAIATRKAPMAQSLASYNDTTVLTDPATARNTSSNDVVSSASVKLVSTAK